MDKGSIVRVRAIVFAHQVPGGHVYPRPHIPDNLISLLQQRQEGFQLNTFADANVLVNTVFDPRDAMPPREEGSRRRCLFRLHLPVPIEGLVTGVSYLCTGRVSGYEYCELRSVRRFSVYVVQPLYTNRWLRPWRCLPGDLEVIE